MLRRRAVLAPGVFAMSYDPLVGAVQQAGLPDGRAADDARRAGRDGAGARRPDRHRRRSRTRSAGLGTYGYVDAHGEDGWAVLEQLGPHTRAEDGTGALLGKLPERRVRRPASSSPARIRALIDTDRARATSSTTATSPTPRRSGPRAWASRPAATRPTLGQGAGQLPAERGGPDGAVRRRVHALPRRRRLPVRLPGDRGGDRRGERDPRRLPADLATEQAAIQERWNDAFGR